MSNRFILHLGLLNLTPSALYVQPHQGGLLTRGTTFQGINLERIVFWAFRQHMLYCHHDIGAASAFDPRASVAEEERIVS